MFVLTGDERSAELDGCVPTTASVLVVVIARLVGAGLSLAAAPNPSVVVGTVEVIDRGSDADRIAAAESALVAKQLWWSSQLAGEPTSPTPRHPKAGQIQEQLRAALLVLDLRGGVTMELIRIPAGESQMGSPRSEPLRHDDEGPVRADRPFGMDNSSFFQHPGVTLAPLL